MEAPGHELQRSSGTSPDPGTRIRHLAGVPGQREHDPRRHHAPPVRLRGGARGVTWGPRHHRPGTPRHGPDGARNRRDRDQPASRGGRRVLHHLPIVRNHNRGGDWDQPLPVPGDFGGVLHDRVCGGLLAARGLVPEPDRIPARSAHRVTARHPWARRVRSDEGSGPGHQGALGRGGDPRDLPRHVLPREPASGHRAGRALPGLSAGGERPLHPRVRHRLPRLHGNDRGRRPLGRPGQPPPFDPTRHHGGDVHGDARLRAPRYQAVHVGQLRGPGDRLSDHGPNRALGPDHPHRVGRGHHLLGHRLDPGRAAHATGPRQRPHRALRASEPIPRRACGRERRATERNVRDVGTRPHLRHSRQRGRRGEDRIDVLHGHLRKRSARSRSSSTSRPGPPTAPASDRSGT